MRGMSPAVLDGDGRSAITQGQSLSLERTANVGLPETDSINRSPLVPGLNDHRFGSRSMSMAPWAVPNDIASARDQTLVILPYPVITFMTCAVKGKVSLQMMSLYVDWRVMFQVSEISLGQQTMGNVYVVTVVQELKSWIR